jgi:outer membrane protein TolC
MNFSVKKCLLFCCFLGWQLALTAVPATAQHLELTPETPAGVRSLVEFATLIKEQSRRIIQEKHDLQAVRHMSQQTRSRFQPTVAVRQDSSKSANRTYNPITGIEEDYSTRRRTSGLSVSQNTFLGTTRLDAERSITEFTSNDPMFFSQMYVSLERDLLRDHGRMNLLELDISRGQVDIQREQLRSAGLDVLMIGLGALIERLIAAGNHAFKLRNLEFYRKMLEEAQVKLENGLGSELDLKQAQMRLTLAETDVQEGVLTLSQADRQLGLSLGDPEWNRELASFPVSDISILVPEEIDIKTLHADGLLDRPDLRLSRLRLHQQEQTCRLAGQKAREDLSAAFRWGRQGRSVDQDMAQDMNDKSWNVAVGWSTTLGRRPEVSARRAEQEKLRSVRVQNDEAIDIAAQKIGDRHEALLFQRKNLADLRQSRVLSADILEGHRLNFQLGKTTMLDLLRYQSDFEASELAVIRAEASLVRSWFQLLYETGKLTDYFPPR